MRAAGKVFVLLVSASWAGAQESPVPARTSGLEALVKKREILAERIRRIQDARIRIDLGLPVDRVFLRSLIPAGGGDPAALREEYARELDRLAALQSRLRDLKARSAKIAAGPVRRKARPAPAEIRPKAAPPAGGGKAAPGQGKAGPKKKARATIPRRKAVVYQVRVKPLLLAGAFFKKGEYEKALALYRKILAEDPKNTGALFRVALCLERTGKPDQALEILARIKADKAGTPWEKAAAFAEESILWRKHFDSLGPLPSPPGIAGTTGKGDSTGEVSRGGGR